MQARLKDDYRWSVITALGGQTYIKTEWRAVPPGKEPEARRHPHLETKLVLSEMSLDELRELGKEHKVSGWNLMKQETLVERLGEVLNG